MKKSFFYLLVILAFASVQMSCKKDKDTIVVTPEMLNSASSAGTVISTAQHTFMMNSVIVAADSGYNVNFPTDGKKSIPLKNLNASANYDWVGPDLNGWYTRSWSSVYDYEERVKFGDTIIHILSYSYHGGDGSYENTTTTRFIKGEKNGKTVYSGESVWDVYASGYSDISRYKWEIKFEDWDPETSAGTYDWYWEVSENSGGETIPYHRCEHLEATETGTEGWLHCHVIWYDDSGNETWNFEYDTPWVPVDMPEIPSW